MEPDATAANIWSGERSLKSMNCWVGGRPEEKGDERMRRWWEGVGGGDEESLDALVARAAGLINKPALLLKQRSTAVLRARARPPPVTKGDSIAKRGPEAGKGGKRRLVSFQAQFFVHTFTKSDSGGSYV